MLTSRLRCSGDVVATLSTSSLSLPHRFKFFFLLRDDSLIEASFHCVPSSQLYGWSCWTSSSMYTTRSSFKFLFDLSQTWTLLTSLTINRHSGVIPVHLAGRLYRPGKTESKERALRHATGHPNQYEKIFLTRFVCSLPIR